MQKWCALEKGPWRYACSVPYAYFVPYAYGTYHMRRGGSRVWKEGGRHLAEKQLKTKKKWSQQ